MITAELSLAAPGTPLPAGVDDVLDAEWSDAGEVRRDELLDDRWGIGRGTDGFSLTWVRLVRDVLARVRVGDPWSMVIDTADDGMHIRGVLPFAVVVDVRGRTAIVKAYPFRGGPPVRWYYRPALEPIGAPA